ncbi:MAG TPA: hypothetical protein VGD69_19940 [Herpetosiphonaceae bacterium]
MIGLKVPLVLQAHNAQDIRHGPAAQEIVAAEGIILLDYRPLQAIWRGA